MGEVLHSQRTERGPGQRARLNRLVAAATLASAVTVIVAIAAPESSVEADEVFTVDSPADAVDANPGDGVCATASGSCTLRAAVQEANVFPGHNTVIVPAGDYELALPPDTGTVIEPPELEFPVCQTVMAGVEDGDLDVTCPLTIVGEGPDVTIVDGGEPAPGAPVEQTALDRIFDIHQSAGDVTISGLTVREGYHAEAGGAIANASGGTLRLENVVVRDSAATNAGGGVYTGEPLEIECPEPCAGGAPTLELVDVDVIDNHAGGSGGGVFVMFGELLVDGGSVSGNHADSGGGVFNGGQLSETGVPSVATFAGVTFEDNVALGAGGAINGDHQGAITIQDSTFNANTAYDYGGAVAVGSKSSLTLRGGSFADNVSVGAGGAVFVAAERAVSIIGTSFAGNKAGQTLPDLEVPGEFAEGEGGGGALFLGGEGPIDASELTISGNIATHEGGGVLIENNASVDLADSVLTSNRSTASTGGGIENAGLRVTLRDLDVIENEAYEDGGGIQGHGSGPFTVIDTTIAHNTAENGGGFTNAADGTTHFKNVLIFDNRAVMRVNDDAGLGGGVYGLGDAFAEYENVTITGNFAQIRGGGFYADADASISVVNSTIARNVAPVASGVGDEGTDFNVPVLPSLSVVFRNTIVAQNLLSPSCNFALGSAGGNLEDGDSCSFRGSRDRVNAAAIGLDAVADNGGPTMTMALQPGSFAVDGGVAPCPATDARGITRPQSEHCDIGAYEYTGEVIADDEPPETQYVSGPYQDTLETSAFTFSGTDNLTPASELLFECRLVEGDPTEAPEPVDPTEPINPLDPELMWVGCPSPWQVKLIEEGLFTLEIRAIDRAGNVDPTPAIHIFGGVDDLAPPNTFFTLTPPNPSHGTVAAFAFRADDGPQGTPPQFMEYECRIDTLDPEAWLECTSPVTFSNLAVGQHTVQVRASDAMDNVDPSPASYTWTVGPPADCTSANITLFADKDAFIDEGLPTQSFGTATELEVRADNNGDARALVSFGVPTEFPDDCVLTGAHLRLFSEGDAGRTLEATPIATSWTETGTSWNNRPTTTGTAAATTSGHGYREWDVTDHVVAMLDGEIPSHGWMIRDEGEGAEPGASHSITSRHLVLEPPETQMPQLILRFDGDSVLAPGTPSPASDETAVTCGQTITASIKLGNDLFDCPFDGLVIGAPNIDVDLNGHTIDGLNYLLTGEEDGLPAGIRNVGHANVRIHNGTVQEHGNGVQLMAGAVFNIVEDLVIRANAVAGVELDDADNGTTGNTIRNNLFLGNGESGVWLVYGTEHAQVLDNTFDGNAGVAIHLLDAHANHVEGNLITGVPVAPGLDSDGGVLLESATDNEIIGNALAETGDTGVGLHLGSHRNLIQGNTLTATGDAGVAVHDGDGNRIINNIAHLGSDAGVSLDNAANSEVRENDVRFNPSGVTLGGVTDSVVAGNDADHSDGAGIAVAGSDRNLLVDNTANNTAAEGISVEGDAVDEFGNPDPSQGNLIDANETNSNLGSGIAIAGVGHTLTRNTANSNAAWGMDAGGLGDNVDGGDNTASGNVEIDPVDGDQCRGLSCGAGAPTTPPTSDVTPPDTAFVATPTDGHGMLETVQFRFTGTDDVAPTTALRYECRLDPGADPTSVDPPDLEPPEPGDPDVFEGENWVECANPVTFRLLTSGEHRFEVRALDPGDNFDPTPAVYEWTVTAMPYGLDDLPPTIAIHERPTDPSTTRTGTFRFGGSDNLTEGPHLTYECSLDAATFAPCTSPAEYPDLDLGPHTFAVRARDLAGLTSPPATWDWTIEEPPPDTTAPTVRIDAAPDPITVNATARFEFTSDEPTATLGCKVDGGTVQTPCPSPQTYGDLETGSHTFVVTATDAAGNEGVATFEWTIGPPAVNTTVSCGQTITASVRLLNDLFECPNDGLIIGAHGITLDLNGHYITGLAFEGSAGVRNNGFDDVTITGGYVEEFDVGVLLNPGTSGNIIRDVTSQLNLVAGIQLSNADSGSLGNLLADNVVGGNGDGIAIVNGTQHTNVIDNVVSGSDLAGVRLVGSSSNTVEGNLVVGSAGAAVILEGASANTIVDNVVDGNGGDAIAVTAFSNSNVIERNHLSESSNGIAVVNSTAAQILDNTIQLMGGAGVRLENAHNGLVRTNDVRFTSVGVELLRSSNNRVEANVASENDGGGIVLSDMSLDNAVVLNTTNFNSADGISVSDPAAAGSGNMIDRNTALNNVSDGIAVTDVGHIIVGNVANTNGSWGIYAATATILGANLDGGGNTAVGNGSGLPELQCFNVVCDGAVGPSADPLSPETTITSAPSDPSVLGVAVTFEFIGFDNASNVSFECRLDGAAWAGCTSPHGVDSLPLGSHTFEVRAVDFIGNADATPASHTWTVGAPAPGVPPDTTLTTAPDVTTFSTQASFEFTADEGGVTFECSFDGAGFTACDSPAVYSGLLPGEHTFAVRAVDLEALPDPTPASFAWVIVAEPTLTGVTCGAVVTQSIRLTNDLLDCPEHGLVVGASGISIDLDGHTIDGIGQGGGVSNNGHDSVVVTNGSIQGFDAGVLLNPGTTGNVVAGLTLMANEVAGIQLVDAEGNLVRDNVLTGSVALAGNGDGISLLGGSSDNVVRGNTVALSGLNGIHVERSNGNRFEANDLSGSSEAGLWLEGASGNTVIRNTMSANSAAGVLVEAFSVTATPSNDNVIEANTIRFNAGPGIGVVESNGSQLLGNTIEDNSGGGIALEFANDSHVRANALRTNAGGIELSDSNNNRIEANTVTAGSGAGVEISGASFNNLVISNLLVGNSGEGISNSDPTGAGTGNLVEGNTVNNSAGNGIVVAAGHTVTGNTVNFNDGWGIFAEAGAIDGGGNQAVGNSEPLQCFGVVCAVGPAPGAPDTTLLTGPPLSPFSTAPLPDQPAVSHSARAWFVFTGADDTTALVDLTFECRLDSTDALAWQECENPAEYLDLSPGLHVFEVRAVDLQEIPDPTPARYEWEYVPPPAGVPPDTFIDSAPPDSMLLEVFFKFHSDDRDASFECSLDGAPFTPCADEPGMIMAEWYVVLYEFEEFEVGPHTFAVRARDIEGLVDPTPATHTWVIGGLITAITDGPAYIAPTEPGESAEGGESTDTTATFTFEANLADMDFVCRLDFAITDFEPCTSPWTYTGLTPGEHVFEVLATDPDGEFEQFETTVYEWVVLSSVDIAPPTSQFTVTPDDASPETLFRFTGTDDQTSAFELTYECRLLVDGVEAFTWTACDNPLPVEPETHAFDLIEGFYGEYAAFEAAATAGDVAHEFTFEVRALDAPEAADPEAPDPEPNVQDPPSAYSWMPVADVEAPSVTILTGPQPPVLVDEEMRFTFDGTDNATAPQLLAFECALDGPEASAFAFAPCDSFLQTAFADAYEVSGLETGEYTLRVRATDLAGNVSADATYAWTVIGPPTSTILSSSAPAAPATTSQTSVVFTFEADQPGSTFACSLNGSAFAPCSSPLELGGLGDGNYTLRILATNEHGLVEVTPVAYDWILAGAGPDGSAPDTTVVTGPDPDVPTTATSAVFTFSSSELGSQFECRLLADLDPTDPTSGFSGCQSGIEITDLYGGPHTFEVRAIDLGGNIDPTPATWTWTVLAPPRTTIESGPESETIDTIATFEFVSSVAGAEFFCGRSVNGVPVDEAGVPIPPGGNPFIPCTSPATYDDLPVGEHAFVVYSQANGYQDAEGDDYDWMIVESTELATALVPSLTATGYEFQFEANDPTATFECSLDGTAFAPCESPVAVDTTGLEPGPHTFAVRAMTLTETEVTPASFTWTIAPADTTPPESAVVSGPADPTVSSTAQFSFSSEFGATFECALAVPGEPPLDLDDPATWDGCSSSIQAPYVLDGLEPVLDEFGPLPYTLHVRAVDQAGNVDPTPAGWTWTILPDVTAPETSIVSGPAEAQQIGGTTVQFVFTAIDDGTPVAELQYECRVSLGPTVIDDWASCDSSLQPLAAHVLENLSPGSYTFEVRATDAALNVDASPATRAFEVLDVTPPAQATIDSGPATETADTVAAFTFSTGDPSDTFQCSLDANAFAPCTSGVEYTGLALGTHQFQARAVDLAGNVGLASDPHVWSVVSAEPSETAIASGPPAESEVTEAIFAFTAVPAVLDYECRLDPAVPEDPWAGCESPHEESGLDVGNHVLEVRAVNAFGVADPTPATWSWTVVAPTLPETTINTAPPATTPDTSALITFSANEPGSSFECALDGAAFNGCEPPVSLANLSLGVHTFDVRAIDEDDNVGAVASHTWEIVPPPPPPPVCSSDTTFAVVADAWIDQGSPTDNKGSDSVLKVMSKGPSQNLRGLVRFAMPASVPEGCVIQTATLRIHADSAATGRTLQALRLTGDWSEGAVNWNTQPATAGPAATTTSGTGYRQWDVTAQVRSMYESGSTGRHGFLIRDASENQDAEQQFFSREKGESPPQLVVSYAPAPPPTSSTTPTTSTTSTTTTEPVAAASSSSSTTPSTTSSTTTTSPIPTSSSTTSSTTTSSTTTSSTTTTSPSTTTSTSTTSTTTTTVAACAGATVTVSATADSWIMQSDSGKNLGTDSVMKVTSKSGSSNTRALVRFSLPAVPSGCRVTGAQLRLFAGGGTNGRTLQAWSLASSWTESGVTWSNQPATTGTAATTTSGTGWRQWNVATQVESMYASSNNGFLIRDANENAGSSPEQQLHSREKAPDNPPQLVITFGP